MTDLNLHQLVDWAKTHARNVLVERREKQLLAFYHLVLPGEQKDAIIGVTWQNDIQKQLTMLGVKAAAQKFHATAAMFVGEAWMVRLDKREPGLDMSNLPAPSQHPDRIEVVQIVATDGPNTIATALEIKRDARGRVVALEELGLPGEGQWLHGRLIDGIIPVTQH